MIRRADWVRIKMPIPWANDANSLTRVEPGGASSMSLTYKNTINDWNIAKNQAATLSKKPRGTTDSSWKQAAIKYSYIWMKSDQSIRVSLRD